MNVECLRVRVTKRPEQIAVNGKLVVGDWDKEPGVLVIPMRHSDVERSDDREITGRGGHGIA